MSGKRAPRRFGPGRLTIYIGAAPGVGKTYRMLQDANDWLREGQDVVAALIETHGRTDTAEQIGALEILPLKDVWHEGRLYRELDVEAIVRRGPEVVLVDELAHSNVGGARAKRYQDIEDILRHGIDVVTAVNIQHLESLHDQVEHITGIKVRERVPDAFIDRAAQIRLIDVAPETLRQRVAEGRIYAPHLVDHALNHFFQLSPLAALRELALLEVAEDVEQRRDRSRRREARQSGQRDRILVCVNHRPHSERLIRRGWRIADRLNAELYVLVVVENRMDPADSRDLDGVERLSRQFEARFIMRARGSRRVGEVIVDVARELKVSQIVIGQPLPPPPSARWGKVRDNPVAYVLQHAEFVDLHVVANFRE